MLQYLSVILADGKVLHPSMFGYGRLVHEALDACVLMLHHMCFELMCSLADVNLSAGAWHFVDDIYLLLCDIALCPCSR